VQARKAFGGRELSISPRKIIVGLLLCALWWGSAKGARSASLEEKLVATTDYVPAATSPVEQLIEVAQKFNIPMAVEWVDGVGNTTSEKKLPARKRSVRKLIEDIVGESSNHLVEPEGGLLRIYSPTAAQHPFNFLNIRLDDYDIKDGDLFAAEDRLRWAIRFTLEPEKYENGWVGGYGHGSDSVFEITKFTISGSDLTIRDVLNRITLAQGNALWVAVIKNDLNGSEPFWMKKGADDEEGGRSVTSGWHFYPLSDIAELAQEQIAVDVWIEELLNERINTIPVILEHGLIVHPGGATGIFSSAGYSLNYSVSIEKIGKDFVTLVIHLTVRRKGEAEQKFDEQLQVTKGKITEIRPEGRIRIRAYVEPRNNPDGRD
jgi:hypothetical protein